MPSSLFTNLENWKRKSDKRLMYIFILSDTGSNSERAVISRSARRAAERQTCNWAPKLVPPGKIKFDNLGKLKSHLSIARPNFVVRVLGNFKPEPARIDP